MIDTCHEKNIQIIYSQNLTFKVHKYKHNQTSSPFLGKNKYEHNI